MTPRVDPEHSEARRLQILRAALAVIGREGLQGASMRHIQAESGLSAGAIYHYFDGKSAIVEALFQASLAENEELLRAVEAAGEPLASLDAIVELVFGQLDRPERADELRAGLVVAVEATRDPELGARWAAVMDDLCRRMEELLRRAQRDGAVDPDVDAEYMARAFLAIYDGFRIQKLVSPHLSTRRFMEVARRMTPMGARRVK